MVELKENGPDGKFVIHKAARPAKAPDITLTRGLREDNSCENWVKDSRSARCGRPQGRGDHRLRLEGEPIKRYKLTNAWPKSHGDRLAQGRRHVYLQEKLVLTCEMIEVE